MIPDDWVHPPDLKAAKRAQAEIAARAEAEDRPASPEGAPLVAGVDCSGASRFAPPWLRALAVLMDPGPPARPRAQAMAEGVPAFPYVPGYLGFREIPCILQAVSRLPTPPGLLLVDGHGLSHPRGCGIATHLGVVLDRPSIGVAKSILVGRMEEELGTEAGSTAPLVWQGRIIAMALRSKRNTRPIFVSTGHRVALPTALAIVRSWLAGYRLPEPTRWADRLAGEARERAKREAAPPEEGA